MLRRRQRTVDPLPQLGPEDDPYVAYLLWRAERDAAEAAEASEAGDADDSATSDSQDDPSSGGPRWVSKLAIWHRNSGRYDR
jgi:hypothetical protein